MTVMEGLTMVGNAIVKGAKAVGAMFASANPLTLVNVGIFVGVSVFTTYCCIKVAKAKREYATNQKKQTPVERAIGLNYASSQNRQNLHRSMHQVKTQFPGRQTKAVEKFNRNAQRYHQETSRSVSDPIMKISQDLDRIIAGAARRPSSADIYNHTRFMDNMHEYNDQNNRMMKDTFRLAASHTREHDLVADPFYLISIIHDPAC